MQGNFDRTNDIGVQPEEKNLKEKEFKLSKTITQAPFGPLLLGYFDYKDYHTVLSISFVDSEPPKILAITVKV